MIGIQTALLPATDWRTGLDLFLGLVPEFGLRACEVHLAVGEYAAALPVTSGETARAVRDRVRPAVTTLGVHLPFSALPASGCVPEALKSGLDFAADVHADYTVLHLRGPARPTEAWGRACAPLAARALERGLALLVENADDVRGVADILHVTRLAAAGLCLDVGHLYERVYPARGLRRKLLIANDRWSPAPFAARRDLPARAGPDGWPWAVARAGETLACVHLHDHDGRVAHLPLGSGRLDWRPLAALRERLAGLPVILAADYRRETPERVRTDLALLKGLLEP